jgi:hypothetical protein
MIDGGLFSCDLGHLGSFSDRISFSRLDLPSCRLVYFIEAYTPLLREAQRQGVHHFEKKGGTPQYWQQATFSGLLRFWLHSMHSCFSSSVRNGIFHRNV